MTKQNDNALALALYGTDDSAKVFAQKCNTKTLQRRAFSNGGVGPVAMTADECRKLCKACNNLEYLEGYEHRVIQYKVSDETVDRYGDIVKAKGVHLANYKRNPVIQFAHDYQTPNVGISLKTWFDKGDNCVYSWALFFDDRLDNTGRSDLIYKLAKANAMRACSVGFMPMATRRPEQEERTALGMGDYGVIYESWDMMEFSPCPVPANPNALRDDVLDEMRANIQRSSRSGLFVPRDVSILKDAPLGLDKATLDILVKDAGAPIVGVTATIGTQTIEREAVLRPYPNEHTARLKEPEEFDDFRRSDGGKVQGADVPDDVSVIWGHVVGGADDAWIAQSLRFPASDWTADEAKSWLDKSEIDYIAFDEALDKEEPSEDEDEEEEGEDMKDVKLTLDITALTEQVVELKNAITELKTVSEHLTKALNGATPPTDPAGTGDTKATVADVKKSLYDSLTLKR